MTSQEKLSVCKQCLNRKFDSKQGIVCSLTDAKPTFEEQCEEFDHDASVKSIYISEEIASQDDDEISTGKAINYIIIGLGLVLGGIAATTMSSEYIYVGAFISGAIFIIKGLKVF